MRDTIKEADQLYADLAGNACSGFCASAVLISMLVHMSWGEDKPKPEAVPAAVEEEPSEAATSVLSDVDSISRICLS